MSGWYKSTRGKVKGISFTDAVFMGLAEDGGLLIPEEIPDYSSRLAELSALDYCGLAQEIMAPYVDEDFDRETLRKLVVKSYASFDDAKVVPVKTLDKGIHFAELFHGPTLAFKDVALQFLGNFFEYALKKRGGRLNVLGATSGDTGSAAIHGLKGKENINIFIMYPEGRVSPLQERQMATVPDSNVHCLAIKGTFDDGQSVLKEVFNDLPFNREFSLGAVNSVNWARILAQVVYYFWAPFEVSRQNGRAADTVYDVTVPTGNFGDIFAGYVAKKMGAPIDRLILATNENDILSRFFTTGEYSRGQVCPTLSPSMDIQVASNFERYLYFRLGENPDAVTAAMTEFKETGILRLSGSDRDFAAGRGDTATTLATIAKYWQKAGYVLDPHSAVGVSVAEKCRQDREVICLGTAHPAKFPQAIKQALGDDSMAHHPALDALLDLPLRKDIVEPTREVIEGFIRANI